MEKYDSSDLPDESNPEISEYETNTASKWFARLVDETILDNIEYAKFNMNTPYEDMLSLDRRQITAASLVTLVLRRRQNLYERGYDAHLSEYVLKSVEVREIASDHVVDSYCFDLQIDGSVIRRNLNDKYAGSSLAIDEEMAGCRNRPATLEEIRDLQDLIQEDV